jgi:glucose-6-phosphate isomerase
VEAKKIEVSEMMDNCAKVHIIAYNNMEEDEAQQEEVMIAPNKKRLTVNDSRTTRKKRTICFWKWIGGRTMKYQKITI